MQPLLGLTCYTGLSFEIHAQSPPHAQRPSPGYRTHGQLQSVQMVGVNRNDEWSRDQQSAAYLIKQAAVSGVLHVDMAPLAHIIMRITYISPLPASAYAVAHQPRHSRYWCRIYDPQFRAKSVR
ncbi:hypothetical protein LSAT2_002021 [Lamellibrachia satsuma]|nr:hypothetical protein LSAT2_002021 [Lamellibrachia satsuma]